MTGKHNGWKSDYATLSDKKNGAGVKDRPFKPIVMDKLFGNIQRRSTIENAPSVFGGIEREKDEIKGR